MSLTTLQAKSRPKNAAVKDINIGIADILGQKYRYHIDISHGDFDPPLPYTAATNITWNVNINSR